jgi:hypothetical protein
MSKNLKIDIQSRIEPFIYERIEDDEELKISKGVPVLTHNRFDVAFKLAYLQGLALESPALFENLYATHIGAITEGSFSEPGNQMKTSLKNYFSEFSTIYNDIRMTGFNGDKSLIPLARDGSLLNGAHRASCCIALGRKASFLETELTPVQYTYNVFRQRGVPRDCLDIASRVFLQYAENCYVVLLWPSIYEGSQEVEKLIKRLVYKKEISLTPKGAHNLICEAYADEPWLGELDEGFPGAFGKLEPCFANANPLQIFIVQAENLTEILELKQSIRNLFSLGKHSVHITDSQEEARRLSELLLSEAGLHFLNYGNPNSYNFRKKLSSFESAVEQVGSDASEYVLDSGMVLECYGLRKADDIDYIATDPISLGDDFHDHSDTLKYHAESSWQLVNNPKFYFVFKGIKFIALSQVLRMKLNRGESKDLKDVKLISPLMRDSKLYKALKSVHYSFLFFVTYSKGRAKALLKEAGLYNVVRSLYRRIK